MKMKRILGIVLLSLGVIFIALNQTSFTGYVIIEDINGTMKSVIGLVLIIAGLLMSIQTSGIEKIVYDTSHGKRRNKEDSEERRDEDYVLLDKDLIFGGDGQINLGQMKRLVKSPKYRNDPELMEMVRESVGPVLVQKLDDDKEGPIAKEFYKALYGHEAPEQKREEIVTDEEESEIMGAFRGGWKIGPNTKQKRVLTKYGFEYQYGEGRYGKIIYSDKPEINVPVSRTPEDVNAGRNIGKDVINLLKSARSSK